MYVAPLPCKFPGASQILQVEMPELQKENVLPEIVSVITVLFPHSHSDCYIKKKKIIAQSQAEALLLFLPLLHFPCNETFWSSFFSTYDPQVLPRVVCFLANSDWLLLILTTTLLHIWLTTSYIRRSFIQLSLDAFRSTKFYCHMET